jgi:hypothetical protein
MLDRVLRLAKPFLDLVGVEPDEMTPFDVRNPPFRDEPTHVADPDAQTLCECRNVDELREALLFVGLGVAGHGDLALRFAEVSCPPYGLKDLRSDVMERAGRSVRIEMEVKWRRARRDA